MTLRLGDIAPDFEQDSSIGKIKFHEWAGDSWVILFFAPGGLHAGMHHRTWA